jgi:hypothetical protein
MMQLEQIVPWGRSLDEYRRMFRLTDADCAGRIVGCGDGPASFNAEMTALGFDVISCDPLYGFTAAEIKGRVEETYEAITAQVWQSLDRYVWTEFANPDAVGQHRLATMERFLDDFERGQSQGRYMNASLPSLPFDDWEFDLAVCSHLLFLYSDHLSLEFHIEAIFELCRVAREARIFPLLTLEGTESPHLAPVQEYFLKAGFKVDVVRVNYEFQRGGNQMLCVEPC